MPKYYSDEAFKSAIYLMNRTPSSVLNFQTPQQKLNLFCLIPHVTNLEPMVFDYVVFVHIPKQFRTKLNPCRLNKALYGLK